MNEFILLADIHITVHTLLWWIKLFLLKLNYSACIHLNMEIHGAMSRTSLLIKSLKETENFIRHMTYPFALDRNIHFTKI